MTDKMKQKIITLLIFTNLMTLTVKGSVNAYAEEQGTDITCEESTDKPVKIDYRAPEITPILDDEEPVKIDFIAPEITPILDDEEPVKIDYRAPEITPILDDEDISIIPGAYPEVLPYEYPEGEQKINAQTLPVYTISKDADDCRIRHLRLFGSLAIIVGGGLFMYLCDEDPTKDNNKGTSRRKRK